MRQTHEPIGIVLLPLPALRKIFIYLTVFTLTGINFPGSHTLAQEETDLDYILRIQTYLNSIQTMRGRFIQVASDGDTSDGIFYLKRPRRFRFEYTPPNPILLVGDGLWLIFHDRELGQTSRMPIASSPLGLLLGNNISLTKQTTVTEIKRESGIIKITLQDARKGAQGAVTLVLSSPPLRLRQWLVTDAQGLTTKVTIFETETNIPIEAKIFTFTDPPPGRR